MLLLLLLLFWVWRSRARSSRTQAKTFPAKFCSRAEVLCAMSARQIDDNKNDGEDSYLCDSYRADKLCLLADADFNLFD